MEVAEVRNQEEYPGIQEEEEAGNHPLLGRLLVVVVVAAACCLLAWLLAVMVVCQRHGYWMTLGQVWVEAVWLLLEVKFFAQVS